MDRITIQPVLSFAGLPVPYEHTSLLFRTYSSSRGRIPYLLTSLHLFIILQDQVLKSGSLNKKAQRTKRWTKYWFVLKNDVLSWYNSSSVSFTHCEYAVFHSDLRRPYLVGSILPSWCS